ncbi:hypothetical protein [Loktanella sp. M215]|uniref:hypothetical protein n=1 Tax=Loktanella sp. M215 TaxID=2675431 RepID=UPI001F3D34C5|nr:hypothetical protein [Loktanella sp. M215]MCF7700554.1 hypothetical protein [Loktanella sp. M215]
MVEKRAIVRLSAEGGETVRAEFVSVGRSAKAMGADLRLVGQDATRMSTDMQKAIASFAGIETEQKSASSSAQAFTAALGREAAQFKSLKAAVDPAYAAQIRYESAVQKVQRAQRLGIATNAEAENTLELLERQYRTTGAATEQMMAATARGTGRIGFQVQNASYQVGDFFVQVAGGTAASRALAMQLPQLLGGFGVVGAAAGAVAAILGALVPMMFETADAAKEIDALTLDGARSAISALADLEDRYALAVRTRGVAQDAVSSQAVLMLGQELEAQRALLRVEEARMNNRAAQLRQQIADNRAALQSQIDAATLGLTPEVGLPDSVRSQTADAALAATQRVLDANESVTLELQQQNAELTLLEIGLRTIEAANQDGAAAVSATSAELESQVAMQALIAQYGEDSVQVTRARAAAERDAFIEIVAAGGETDAMKVSMIAAYDAANGIASADMAGGIAQGASEAERLAAWLGISLSRALEISRTTSAMAAEDAAMGVSVTPDGSTRAQNRSAVDNLIRLTTPPKVTGRTGGGGSRGRTPAVSDAERKAEQERNRMGREAERVIASMRTETEKYNDELRDLAELNTLGYFKDAPEAYARAVADLDGKLNDAKFGPMLKGMQSVNAEIARAIVTSGDLGDVFTSQLQRMAESLLTSGLDQLATAIFFPGATGGQAKGGGPGSLLKAALNLPSFEGGGGTGTGSRSGGLDGRGGFLSLLHPNETVLDHTRYQRNAPTSMTQNIVVNGATGNAEIRAMVAAGVKQGNEAIRREVPGIIERHTKVAG